MKGHKQSTNSGLRFLPAFCRRWGAEPRPRFREAAERRRELGFFFGGRLAIPEKSGVQD